ncbi:MAG: arylsulfatase [Planctomycetota bacterium]|nr:arylsulfatase [Planctomycetota bacterium]
MLQTVLVTLLTGLFPGQEGQKVQPAPSRPNIVVILADDMGFSDIGCYGGEIRTPHLDELAAGGLRFSQFYNTARCCPTRASLLTGLYPHQAGVGHMVQDLGKPGYTGELNATCRTLGEVARSAGYHTCAVGKWHVTGAAGAKGPKNNWPLGRGFDRYYGTIHGAGSFFDPSSLVRDNTMISAFDDPEYKPSTYYYTDAISHHASRFVREHAASQSGKPFLMYMAYTAAHWPMHALPADIARQKGRYDSGYEPVRQARWDKAAGLGLIDPTQGMSPAVGDWNKQDKTWEAAGMEVYAAMVERMDLGIGQVVAELRKAGQFDNTLLLYLQDNGGCAEPMGRSPGKNHPNIARPKAPTLPAMKATEFITAGSVPAQTRDGYPVRMGNLVMPGPADTYVAYGRNWATVSNTPFREYKHWVHEGGISTPLVAHWPRGISARGELRHQPGHLIDIMATLVELAGASYPQKATPLVGRSLLGAFAGKVIDREALYWEHEGNRAVRQGNWKLVARHKGPWELYDIAKDRVEGTDLSASQPDKVRELAKLYQAYASRSLVEPWPVTGIQP